MWMVHCSGSGDQFGKSHENSICASNRFCPSPSGYVCTLENRTFIHQTLVLNVAGLCLQFRENFWSFKISKVRLNEFANRRVRHCSIRTHDMIEFMQNSERGRAITSFDVQSIKLLPIFLSSTVSEYHIDPMKYSKYFTLLLHSIVSVSAELCAVHCVWPYKPSFWMSNPTTISHHDDDISIVFFLLLRPFKLNRQLFDSKPFVLI